MRSSNAMTKSRLAMARRLMKQPRWYSANTQGSASVADRLVTGGNNLEDFTLGGGHCRRNDLRRCGGARHCRQRQCEADGRDDGRARQRHRQVHRPRASTRTSWRASTARRRSSAITAIAPSRTRRATTRRTSTRRFARVRSSSSRQASCSRAPRRPTRSSSRTSTSRSRTTRCTRRPSRTRRARSSTTTSRA